MHAIVSAHSFPQITLDFSNCRLATQAVMLPLLPIINDHRTRHAVEFTLIRLQDYEVDRAFTNGNWAHLIEPERYGGDSNFEDVVLLFNSKARTRPRRYLIVLSTSCCKALRLVRAP